jgi:hypothetical protein
VDIAITDVFRYTLETRNPDIDKPRAKARADEAPKSVQATRAAKVETRLERYPELADFYNKMDMWDVSRTEKRAYEELLETLDDAEKQLLMTDKIFYAVALENVGGLVMPVVMQITWADGTVEDLRLPAEVWMDDSRNFTKLLVAEQEIETIVVDPHLEMADANPNDNTWPKRAVEATFQLQGSERDLNRMQDARGN